MKKINIILLHLCAFLLFSANSNAQVEQFVLFQEAENVFTLTKNSQTVTAYVDNHDEPAVLTAIESFRQDILAVTGTRLRVDRVVPQEGANDYILVIGTLGKSRSIDKLVQDGKIDKKELEGKNEKYIIQTVANPFPGVKEALVIAGSDRRGTIYGIYELSSQIGVSPWYYWADVAIKTQENLYIKKGKYTDGEPAVRLRGIFLNDEAPALTGWTKEVFGGINSKFYEKLFELILRLKGNFLWPAMWGNAFYYDDVMNGPLAHNMGIVMGTSHHEPFGRAHVEWRYFGEGAWDYKKNPQKLREFWTGGLERMKDYETIVTLGMRGDGDEPMSAGADISLLERIVRDQRQIISKVTGKKAEQTPQVWALYKEVQDYYDMGMRVPDDVTLLLCDDNWGNVRKLPDPNAKPRKGGYGMYYHFDYVGGPRNYKWLNVTQVQRTWEQMNLSYEHGVKELWVVNVGDMKPMEYPISFFLDMAWAPERFNANNIYDHTVNWCKQQFGEEYAEEAARMLNLYTKYNRRVTPEMLSDKTYSMENYDEFERVTTDYKNLLIEAQRLYYIIPAEHKDAFDQLVLFPINGVCNLYEMYFAVAKNARYAEKNDVAANYWADKVKYHYDHDSLITNHYNNVIAGGKWPHMMDQIRIGYTYWQQPRERAMPAVTYVAPPTALKPNLFIENDGYVSIEANNFSRLNNSDEIKWEVIPHLSKTESSVTTFPQSKYPKSTDNIYLEYDIDFKTAGEFDVEVFVAPTLNYNANKGLRYALSFNGEDEQIVNFNGHYKGHLGQWQGESIIKTTTKLTVKNTGKQTLRFRVLEPGIVLQKILINTGGLKPTYLGAPESQIVNQ